MTRIISSADANREFASILREAEKGETVVITRRNKPVAQLAPVTNAQQDPVRKVAGERLLRLLREGLQLGGETVSRDDAYEDL